MKRLMVLMILVLSAGLSLAAGQVANHAPEGSARVRGGLEVVKAGSARDDAQWAARRPDFQYLRPGTQQH